MPTLFVVPTVIKGLGSKTTVTQPVAETATQEVTQAATEAMTQAVTEALTKGPGCPQGCATPPPGCEIKGNISSPSGEKIYHMPGQENYEETEIVPDDGERWFCTEQEAEDNGWRKALN